MEDLEFAIELLLLDLSWCNYMLFVLDSETLWPRSFIYFIGWSKGCRTCSQIIIKGMCYIFSIVPWTYTMPFVAFHLKVLSAVCTILLISFLILLLMFYFLDRNIAWRWGSRLWNILSMFSRQTGKHILTSENELSGSFLRLHPEIVFNKTKPDL